MSPAAELVAWVRKLSTRHRENNHWHAYYTLPVLFGFGVTYLLIRILQPAFPNFHFDAGGYHIHHYTYGIFVLLIFGYISLWTNSPRVKYLCALAYGVSIAFILDEAGMWFTLTDNYVKDYDLIFYIAAIFITIALSPLLFKNKKDAYPPQP